MVGKCVPKRRDAPLACQTRLAANRTPCFTKLHSTRSVVLTLCFQVAVNPPVRSPAGAQKLSPPLRRCVERKFRTDLSCACDRWVSLNPDHEAVWEIRPKLCTDSTSRASLKIIGLHMQWLGY